MRPGVLPRAPVRTKFWQSCGNGRGLRKTAGDRHPFAHLHEIDMSKSAPPTIDTFDLATVERLLCTEALRVAGGSINIAAKMLGITRHALRRRINKYRLARTRSSAVDVGSNSSASR